MRGMGKWTAGFGLGLLLSAGGGEAAVFNIDLTFSGGSDEQIEAANHGFGDLGNLDHRV